MMPLRLRPPFVVGAFVVGCCVALPGAFAFRRLSPRAAKQTTQTESATNAAPLTVKGSGFTVAPLQQNGPAFSNRAYRWLTVPSPFAGWQYTQTSGGESAHITVTATSAGTIWAISSAAALSGGWEPQSKTDFAYFDKTARFSICFGGSSRRGKQWLFRRLAGREPLFWPLELVAGRPLPRPQPRKTCPAW